MSTETKLTPEDAEWIQQYGKDVTNAFEGLFESEKSRFKEGSKLLDRFKASIKDVLDNGWGRFRTVDESHNELCVAESLLKNPNPTFVTVEYEPPLSGCEKTIDFRAVTADGLTLYVDVKTVKPLPKDRWDQYKKAQNKGWFPENVKLLFSKEWLGGELWHNAFAARSRFLEYTLELEQKIDECSLRGDNISFVLIFCGEGFYWHEDELEDFVAYYFSGSHRSDDPFGNAEAKYIDEKKLIVAKVIHRFACMKRPQGEIRQRCLNWNVQPPCDPSFD